MSDDYAAFLDRKAQIGTFSGFDPLWLPSFLFDFQQALVDWALRKGKAAIFADCGLGKTPMQLVWAENIVRKTNGRVLILTPLAVGAQTLAEGVKFGIECARSRDGSLPPSARIVVTNYEQLHRFTPADFVGVVCDESSILKHFSGATQMAVTRFMAKVPYRLLCTATAAPNDHTELGTSSEALGELGYSDMLSRFFRQSDNKPHRMQEIKEWRARRGGDHYAKLAFRVSQQIGQWRLKGHAVTPFWRWVCSWARACRHPSDLGFDDQTFSLPELIERDHVIAPRRPADGMLFTLPAFGLKEEREERRRTLEERCEFVARLVDHRQPAVVWCHFNGEGDLLEHMIPNSIQVKGDDTEEWKEQAARWFKGEICICAEPMFRARLAAWRKDRLATGSNIIKSIANSDSPSQRSTPPSTETRGANTAPRITGRTKKNGDDPIPQRPPVIKSAGNAMPPIPTSAVSRSKRLSSTDSDIQPPGLCATSDDTELPSKSIESMNSKDARSVSDLGAETREAIASTSITATEVESSEDSSARIVILGSESSEMIQRYLNAPPCICGHQSGRRILISKSRIYGFGLNFQHCAHVVTFATHSYEQFYQSIRRCWRFGQEHPVVVDIVATEGERGVKDNMLRKATLAEEMFSQLVTEMQHAMHISRDRDDTRKVEIPSWV